MKERFRWYADHVREFCESQERSMDIASGGGKNTVVCVSARCFIWPGIVLHMRMRGFQISEFGQWAAIEGWRGAIFTRESDKPKLQIISTLGAELQNLKGWDDEKPN